MGALEGGGEGMRLGEATGSCLTGEGASSGTGSASKENDEFITEIIE